MSILYLLVIFLFNWIVSSVHNCSTGFPEGGILVSYYDLVSHSFNWLAPQQIWTGNTNVCAMCFQSNSAAKPIKQGNKGELTTVWHETGMPTSVKLWLQFYVQSLYCSENSKWELRGTLLYLINLLLLYIVCPGWEYTWTLLAASATSWHEAVARRWDWKREHIWLGFIELER